MLNKRERERERVRGRKRERERRRERVKGKREWAEYKICSLKILFRFKQFIT